MNEVICYYKQYKSSHNNLLTMIIIDSKIQIEYLTEIYIKSYNYPLAY